LDQLLIRVILMGRELILVRQIIRLIYPALQPMRLVG